MSFLVAPKDILIPISLMRSSTEANMISFSGGMVGVLIGLSIAFSIAQLADIPTIVSFYSILLSFGVAVTVGVVFGIAPAKRAASQDPITCLRYE